MPKGFIYVRYSTAEQGQGDSVSRQMRMARQFAISRPEMQLDIVEDPVFVDLGVSSFLGNNLAPDRGLGKFIAAVECGEVPAGSALLIESLDRLSRQELRRAQQVFHDILNRGITIITTSPVETHVYNGQSQLFDFMMMLVQMERAHGESAQKSRRVKEAWERKREQARNGAIISRICPQWLKVSADGKDYEVDEAKAAVVRTIFDCAETMGYQSIAKYLNARGIPPFSSKAKGWQASRIVKIVTNPAAIGIYQPRTIEHVRIKDGPTRRRTQLSGPPMEKYPAVVSAEQFNRVQLQRTLRSKDSSGRKGETISNLFSRVAKCGYCGNNMVMVQKGSSGGRDSYLVCTIARRGAGCSYRSWPYDALEQSFLNYCQNVDVSELVPSQSSDAPVVQARKQLAALTGELQTTKATIARLMGDITANGGQIPRAVQSYLVDAEKTTDRLDDEIREKASELLKLQEEQRGQNAFGDMFQSLIADLSAADKPERLRLRSGLQKAISSAGVGMKLFHSTEEESNSWAEVLGPGTPPITHHYMIVFRSGVAKMLHFSGRRLIFVVDNEKAKPGAMNLERVPLEPNPDVRRNKARGPDGKWLKPQAAISAANRRAATKMSRRNRASNG